MKTLTKIALVNQASKNTSLLQNTTDPTELEPEPPPSAVGALSASRLLRRGATQTEHQPVGGLPQLPSAAWLQIRCVGKPKRGIVSQSGV
jgi:hypothetical protein